MSEVSTPRSIDPPTVSPAVLIARLLSWYDDNRRDLPWRQSRDPYAIWVSEIMLQQTRVETVIPYYERFLERFPRLEDLAAADREAVLAMWSGLGYYRRARNLHRAAQEVVASGGSLPTDSRSLRRLPGIGHYTAAAVASIAFGEAVAAIDGNIERVITRLYGIGGDPRRGQARKSVAQVAGDLIDVDRAGDSNQALMELGATVCRPRQPLCAECPLAELCVAWRVGDPEGFPSPRERPGTIRVERWVGVVRSRHKVLLIRRHDDSRQLPGMWTLPWVDRQAGASAAAGFNERYGGRWTIGKALGRIRHSITRRDFRIEIVEAQLDDGAEVAEGLAAGWFDRRQLEELPKSSLVDKVLVKVGFLPG